MGCAGVSNEKILAVLFVIAPQFATTDPVKIASYNVLIEALECMINCQLLGCCAALAYANLLAHYLTMQTNPYLGVGTSISEGQLSLGFSSTTDGNFFGSSPYGQAYLNIVSRFKIGAMVTNALPRWHGPPCC